MLKLQFKGTAIFLSIAFFPTLLFAQEREIPGLCLDLDPLIVESHEKLPYSKFLKAFHSVKNDQSWLAMPSAAFQKTLGIQENAVILLCGSFIFKERSARILESKPFEKTVFRVIEQEHFNKKFFSKMEQELEQGFFQEKVYSFIPEPGKKIILLIAIRTSEALRLNGFLWEERDYISEKRKNDFALGLYYGGFFIIIAINLVLFVSLRERVYAYYTLYAISMS